MKRAVKVVASILLALYLILQVLSFNYQRKEGLRVPEKMIVTVTLPLQKAVRHLMKVASEGFDHYMVLSNTSKLNKQLLLERDQLQSQVIALKELEAENIRLRKILDLGETHQLTLVGAKRIAFGASPFERTIRINHGKSNGFFQGFAVIHPKGTIGQILQVFEESADVLLLTDPASAVDAIDQRSRARGILRGYAFDELKFEYVSKAEDIQVGDEIVTSGLDGVYPKGIPIGIVTKVAQGKSQLFLSAFVKPHVDFGHIEEVAVVLNNPEISKP